MDPWAYFKFVNTCILKTTATVVKDQVVITILHIGVTLKTHLYHVIIITISFLFDKKPHSFVKH